MDKRGRLELYELVASPLAAAEVDGTPRSLAEKPQKCTKSAENCAHSYTVFEPKTCQEWLFGCVSRPKFYSDIAI